MKDGFLRVAAASPVIKTSDCLYNANSIIEIVNNLDPDCAIVVFPELCITGSTCGNLFSHSILIENAEKAVKKVVDSTKENETIVVVGVPINVHGALYNCAAVIQKGAILALVPKDIPSDKFQYKGFKYSFDGITKINYAGTEIPFGEDIVFCCSENKDFTFGIKLGSLFERRIDKFHKTNIKLIACPCAEPERITYDEFRRKTLSVETAISSQSIIYSAAGIGEATSDAVFSGHCLIAENGHILAESEKFKSGVIYSDIDLKLLAYEQQNKILNQNDFYKVFFSFEMRNIKLNRVYKRSPFTPKDKSKRQKRFEDILQIQSSGLVHRLNQINSKAVLGLSGGLDSSLALLVVIRAYDILGWNRKDIHCITMPCFGTTKRTLENARMLANASGVTLHEIDITSTVRSHLKDIEHSGEHDITFENAQARERTQVLMDMANKLGSIVIGTGNLSEMALGWATFNGDHMSMYSVNVSIPKTMVRLLVDYESKRIGGKVSEILDDIVATPISPELLPPKDGNISQKTEDFVGPYELHDFFLFYFIRYGFAPSKIYRISIMAFNDKYDEQTIKEWLKVFIKRFFSQQFKRSSQPDAPQVGSVTLSPRGYWNMPSDMKSDAWIFELEN